MTAASGRKSKQIKTHRNRFRLKLSRLFWILYECEKLYICAHFARWVRRAAPLESLQRPNGPQTVLVGIRERGGKRCEEGNGREKRPRGRKKQMETDSSSCALYPPPPLHGSLQCRVCWGQSQSHVEPCVSQPVQRDVCHEVVGQSLSRVHSDN